MLAGDLFLAERTSVALFEPLLDARRAEVMPLITREGSHFGVLFKVVQTDYALLRIFEVSRCEFLLEKTFYQVVLFLCFLMLRKVVPHVAENNEK